MGATRRRRVGDSRETQSLEREGDGSLPVFVSGAPVGPECTDRVPGVVYDLGVFPADPTFLDVSGPD